MNILSSSTNDFPLDLKDVSYNTVTDSLQDVLSLIKLYLEVFNTLPEASTEETASLLDSIEAAWLHISSREDASLRQMQLPLVTLRETLHLSFYEYLCLLLALSIELDEGLCKIFTSLCGSAYPTFHLAMCLYGITEKVEEDIFKSADLTHSVLKYVLYSSDTVSSHQSLMRHPLGIKKSVVLYLTNSLIITDGYCERFVSSEPLNLAPLHVNTLASLNKQLSLSLRSDLQLKQAVILQGPSGVGKKTVVKQVCSTHHIDCIFLNMKSLESLDKAAFEQYTTDLCLKLFLGNSLLCLTNCQDKEHASLYKAILAQLEPVVKIVFLCFDNPFSTPIECGNFRLLLLELSTSLLPDKMLIWSYMKERYQLAIDPKRCASQYDITIGKLEAILNNCQFAACYEGSPVITQKHLIKSILSTNTVASNTYLVKYPYTFADLVLDDKTMETLTRISNYVKYRYTIFEDWGYTKKLAYGQGLSMLFYGAPGTGKTMCASVLANEWGLDLVKVDLSKVIDKYIGETEKRLDKIFTSAKQNNCVLFFDEADSLFSKRTEISSSNDKYANIEVSHLLQKMELYDGIVILATNLVQNFDEAFKRRINFMLRFNLPTSDIRKELWIKAFPPEAPLSTDIDFDLLGEKYELSPSTIKSIALYAAFLSAADSHNICMSDVLEGIKYEYEKIGKIMLY